MVRKEDMDDRTPLLSPAQQILIDINKSIKEIVKMDDMPMNRKDRRAWMRKNKHLVNTRANKGN